MVSSTSNTGIHSGNMQSPYSEYEGKIAPISKGVKPSLDSYNPEKHKFSPENYNDEVLLAQQDMLLRAIKVIKVKVPVNYATSIYEQNKTPE